MTDTIRELDARVAVARGWTDLRPEPGKRTLGIEPMDDSGLPAINYIPRYSTDIAAAWVLVEEMDAAGQDWALEPDPPRWCFSCNGYHYGTSAQEAICKAYLAWKAGE